MQFDKDMTSPYKTLFITVREFILSFENIVETKKIKLQLTHSMDLAYVIFVLCQMVLILIF